MHYRFDSNENNRVVLLLRRAASLRGTTHKKHWGNYPVGFARAEGARSTHGYGLVAAARLALLVN